MMDNEKIASELVKAAKDLMASEERQAKYPPKAMDLNKLPDTDGLWDWTIDEAKLYSGASLRPQTVGDVIFWLNMVGGAWKRISK
jgi:hypothetical protein